MSRYEGKKSNLAPPDLKADFAGLKVLVTGGAGAIGSNLVRQLVAWGSKVVAIDDFSAGQRQNLGEVENQIEFIEGDIRQDDVLGRAFANKPDLVFHLAAFFANQNSVEFPEQDLATNGMGTLQLCRWATEVGSRRLIFASSSCVYGMAAGAISESAPLDPHTPYAITKILGEQYVRFYGQYFGLDTVVLRLFNSFGPGEMPGRYRNVIPNFINRALQGEPLALTGTGEETRDFTFVGDTVRGMLLAGALPEAVGQTFNLGTGKETRIVDLALAVNEITGSNGGLVHHPPRSWDRISRRCAQIGKARKMIGYEPEVDLREGLEITYRWLLEQVGTPADMAV